MAGSATEVETAAIVIFAGRYYSGMPYEDPATVFLKVGPAPESSVSLHLFLGQRRWQQAEVAHSRRREMSWRQCPI